MTKVDIKKLGFSAAWTKEAERYEGLYAGRVAAQSKDISYSGLKLWTVHLRFPVWESVWMRNLWRSSL